MRFVDLLRTTVLLSMAAASALALVTLVGATSDGEADIVWLGGAWWLVAGAIGIFLGRRTTTLAPIARVLASSKAATMLPEHRPGAVVLNRLWPLLLLLVLGGGAGLVAPQVAAIAAGFPIIWSLYWRHQAGAVQAVEERDGVTFYVERTSPVKPVALVRTPGLRREVPGGPEPSGPAGV